MVKKDFIFVYVACRDLVEARKIAGHCVSDRLAASANIIPHIESFYWWDGTVNADNEAVVILKTVADKFKIVEETVKSLHSYECPCIVSLPVTDGFKPYLEWMVDSTRACNC